MVTAFSTLKDGFVLIDPAIKVINDTLFVKQNVHNVVAVFASNCLR